MGAPVNQVTPWTRVLPWNVPMTWTMAEFEALPSIAIRPHHDRSKCSDITRGHRHELRPQRQNPRGSLCLRIFPSASQSRCDILIFCVDEANVIAPARRFISQTAKPSCSPRVRFAIGVDRYPMLPKQLDLPRSKSRPPYRRRNVGPHKPRIQVVKSGVGSDLPAKCSGAIKRARWYWACISTAIFGAKVYSLSRRTCRSSP